MRIIRSTPESATLTRLADALASWQSDDAAIQLHPGDLGWFSGVGAEKTAAAIRLWSIEGRIVAIGLLDGPTTLRMAMDPDMLADRRVAEQIAIDLDTPAIGVLPAGPVAVEARGMKQLTRCLLDRGWAHGEQWSTFRWIFSEPVPPPDTHIQMIDARQAGDFVEVHWNAFKETGLPCADRVRLIERFENMLRGPFADRGQALIGFDNGTPVAVALVWSAGTGRPGLLEPLGVHVEHRRKGFARAMITASAAALQHMGASGMFVATNLDGARRTYLETGFSPDAPVADICRIG